MLRAIFFDFNGVLVDDESLHCRLFQMVLRSRGIDLDTKDYYEKYLGFDDEDCFRAILKDHGRISDPVLLQELIRAKSAFYENEVAQQDLWIPGAKDFVREVSKSYLLGIVSGALKKEIEYWLNQAGLVENFQVIVPAEEVQHGKPDPEGYLRALNHLNRDCLVSSERLIPKECLVIEDSIWGIESAHAAGMRCLGLATSYTSAHLRSADWVANSYAEIPLEKVLKDFSENSFK